MMFNIFQSKVLFKYQLLRPAIQFVNAGFLFIVHNISSQGIISFECYIINILIPVYEVFSYGTWGSFVFNIIQ